MAVVTAAVQSCCASSSLAHRCWRVTCDHTHLTSPPLTSPPHPSPHLATPHLTLPPLTPSQVREAISANLLKLTLLLIEGMAEGDATAPLLLQIDLGAGLPLWRLRFGRLEETKLAGPQPLLSALYTILSDFLHGNLRRAGMQVYLARAVGQQRQ